VYKASFSNQGADPLLRTECLAMGELNS